MSEKLKKACREFIIERENQYVSKELLFEAGFKHAVRLLESDEAIANWHCSILRRLGLITSGKWASWLKEQK